jgi:S-adenosylmethionine synthetase
VEKINALPVEEQPVELVERKGIGHPDSICDATMASGTFAFCGSFETHCLSKRNQTGVT